MPSAPRIYWGVLGGLLVGLAHFLYRACTRASSKSACTPTAACATATCGSCRRWRRRLYALRMDAELDFASASTLERAIAEHLAAQPDVRHVCLFAQPINRIDITGVEVFGADAPHAAEPRRHAAPERHQAAGGAGAANAPACCAPGPLLQLYRTDVEALLAFGRLSARRP